MRTIILVLAVLFANVSFGQITVNTFDPYIDTLFAHNVKSLDEFMARFNGKEAKPGMSTDSSNRPNNILSVFDQKKLVDYSAKHGDDSQLFNDIASFVKLVCEKNITLKPDDDLFFAEAVLDASISGKSIKISLLLSQENTGNNIYRWSIAGVKGLISNGYPDTTQFNGISAVDHEMKFMELRSRLNAGKNMTAYRAKNVKIDELSFFMALVQTKQLNISQCSEVIYHFYNIPGYVFKVTNVKRKDLNSGWLITDFETLKDSELSKKVKEFLNQN